MFKKNVSIAKSKVSENVEVISIDKLNEEVKSSDLSNKEKLDIAKQKNKDIRKNIKSKKTKLFVIITILLIVLIGLISALVMYLNNLKYKPYLKYEEKMKTYGFDKMYNDKSAKTSESVTKTEAIKLALAAVFNTYDISGFAAVNTEYQDAMWSEYGQDMGIVKEDINSSNFKDKVKYRDVISYFENCKIKFLPKVEIKDTEIKLKDISKYTTEEQAAIKDMLAYEIITLMSKKLNGNENIFKGKLNELVVNFVEKYNTITIGGEKINVNPEKIPSNADFYPYTLASIDKSVYEKEGITGYDKDKRSAKYLYSLKKDYYIQVKMYTEGFFNNILNIDYRTITEESFKEKIEKYLIVKPEQDVINAYVKYVKDNEIIIEGSSKFQDPIFYYDGSSYRARMELKFEVKNSKTKQNLLYLDSFIRFKKTYEKTAYDIFSDYSLNNVLKGPTMYLNETELYGTILGKDTCGITREPGAIKDPREAK